MKEAAEVAQGKPILIDKFLEGREVEVDAICDGETVLIPGSWSTSSAPACTRATPWRRGILPRHLDADEKEVLRDYTERIAPWARSG